VLQCLYNSTAGAVRQRLLHVLEVLSILVSEVAFIGTVETNLATILGERCGYPAAAVADLEDVRGHPTDLLPRNVELGSSPCGSTDRGLDVLPLLGLRRKKFLQDAEREADGLDAGIRHCRAPPRARNPWP